MKYLVYITDMSECLGAGVWGVDLNILHFMFKNIQKTWRLVVDLTHPHPPFVKLAYQINQTLARGDSLSSAVWTRVWMKNIKSPYGRGGHFVIWIYVLNQCLETW